MVQRKLEQLLAGSPLQLLAAPRDLAFGLVALYFGVDMLSHLQGDQSRAESLLDLATRLAVLGRRRPAHPTRGGTMTDADARSTSSPERSATPGATSQSACCDPAAASGR